jgi:glycosyltransferase involved in cell wall biosynthesis
VHTRSDSQQVHLAVIIAFYNRRHYLRELLASFCESPDEGFTKNIEIVLVDDGSETDPFVEQDIPQFLKHMTRLFRISHQGRPAPARNFGAKQCDRATHLMFIDSDDRLCVPGLQRALETVGRIHADIYPINYRYISATGEPSAPYGRNVQFPWYDLRHLVWTQVGYHRALLHGNPLMISSLIRREIFQALGGFNETISVEDYELWLRAAYHGYRFRYIPHLVCEKRQHAGSRSLEQSEDVSSILESIRTPQLEMLMGGAYRDLEGHWLRRLHSIECRPTIAQRITTVFKSL